MKEDAKNLHVLVVDDEPLILWGIAKILENRAVVKTVGTAEEALDEIMVQHYDLCFLDYNLPGMKGLEALKIINARSPRTKVAIISGSYMDEPLKRQIEENAYEFIEKPFDASNINRVADRATKSLN